MYSSELLSNNVIAITVHHTSIHITYVAAGLAGLKQQLYNHNIT